MLTIQMAKRVFMCETVLHIQILTLFTLILWIQNHKLKSSAPNNLKSKEWVVMI